MTSYSAQSLVGDAVYTALNVAAVTTLTKGVGDDVAQTTAFPYVLFVVVVRPASGLGSQPGRSGFVSDVTVRLHVFSQYGGGKEAQAIADVGIGALLVAFDAASPTVTIVGYKTCDCVWTDTSEPFDSIVSGVKVKEVVAQFSMRVELS